MSKRIILVLTSVLGLLTGAHDVAAQQRQITGTVVSGEAGEPLRNATVSIAGTNQGATTDPQGNFTLAVPAGDVQLRVTQIGYTTREIAVPAGQNSVQVTLAEDILNLEGIVVTGQATSIARRNLPNAVAVVTAQELQRAPAQTVEKALQGKIAGANITTNSGAPGGGVQIQLRGVSSIGGNSDPLFVVDGVIASNVGIASGQNAVSQASRGSIRSASQDQLVNRIADLNPNDIETIEVLKGASAAAIYGSKAANGVILITTKRGRAGAPQINFTQRVGYFELANELGARVWTRDAAIAVFGLDDETADLYFNPDGTQKAVYDNEEAVFGRRDPSVQTTLSVSGGTENTRYYVSGLYQDDEGIAENTGYEKQSILVNLDQNFGERASLGVSANVLHSVAARGLTGNDNAGTSYYSAISFTPSFFDLSARDADGRYVDNLFERSNPAQTAALSTNDEDVWRVIASTNLGIDLVESDRQTLRLVGVGGVDYFQQRNELFYPPELQFEPNDDDLPGTASLGVGANTNLNANLNLVHTFEPVSGAFLATTSIGTQYEDRDLQVNQTLGRNVSVRIPADAARIEVFGTRSRSRDFGAYIQEELLLFNERLNLTGSIRGDRSSNNADEGKYYFFPKAAASYRIPDLAASVDELKFRLAYGSTGNLPFYGQRFTPAVGGTNLEGVVGIRVSGPVGDENLRPERTKELEGGFDATLFGGNARLEVTGFRKTVEDFIIAPPLAPSTGFGAYTFNGGEFEVEGIEAMLEATPLRNRRFSWVTRTTFATDRAEVTELNLPGESPQYRPGFDFGFDYGGYQIKEGRSPTALIGFREGVDTAVVFGDANPDFRMGFSNDLSYGGFRLASLLDWAKGGLAANLTRNYYDGTQNTEDFTGCNTSDTCPGQVRLDRFNNGTSVYIEDAGYVKLREIALSYEIPSGVLERVYGGLDNARLSLSGRNVKTWTDYTGLDPEVSNFGNRAVGRGIDVTPFPPSRSFWLSLDLGF